MTSSILWAYQSERDIVGRFAGDELERAEVAVMSPLAELGNYSVPCLALAVVLGELCWALYAPAWNFPDEPGPPAALPLAVTRRTRFAAREIGRIQTTCTSEFARLSWAWALRANGEVRYRLSHIDGRPERNEWQLVCRLSSSEREAIGTDSAMAADLLARIAGERGHYSLERQGDQQRETASQDAAARDENKLNGVWPSARGGAPHPLV